MALKLGIVSRTFDDRVTMDGYLFKLAEKIAEKSPVAVVGVKKTIDFYKREMVKRSLDYVKTLNMSLIFTQDAKIAAMGFFGNKEKPVFPKL